MAVHQRPFAAHLARCFLQTSHAGAAHELSISGVSSAAAAAASQATGLHAHSWSGPQGSGWAQPISQALAAGSRGIASSRAPHGSSAGPAMTSAAAAGLRAFSSSSTSSSAPSSASSPFSPPSALPQRRVVVTGLGLVTPLGVGVQQSWSNLIQGAVGVKALTVSDMQNLPAAQQALLEQLPCKVGALVPKEPLAAALARIKEDARRSAPHMLYALLAAEEALQDAKWAPSDAASRAATGVALGSGMSGCSEVAEAYQLMVEGKLRRVSPFFVPRILPNMAAGAVGIRHSLNGPNHATSTACATGVHAIGDAFRMVQRGDAEIMVAGATEACVEPISLAGFCRLRALSTGYNSSPEKASRPFDRARDGFVMGEGAGVLILEEAEHAAARGARVYAEVRGYGLSGDGHHITQPHPEGLGGQLCMHRALKGSGVRPEQVVYINAHATSTPIGDEIEQSAILAVFGEGKAGASSSSRREHPLLVSSTKGATGHLLGAAGAVETVFTVLALAHSIAPPTANLEDPHPQLLPGLVGKQAVPLPEGPKAALCNSFGFGGTNASLLLTTAP